MSVTLINVTANMPGLVASINVEIGEQVKPGHEVLVLESMKMQIPVYVGQTGTVKNIRVKVGDSVRSSDVLMELA